MWTDDLTVAGAVYTQSAMDALQNVPWAKPLLSRVAGAGGLKATNMPLLFEVRFAYEVHLAGAIAEYEYAAGVGDSTVDFRIQGERDWLVELVSLRETEALKRATQSTAIAEGVEMTETLLTTGQADKQTEEDEMVTAQGKIGKKAFLDEKPTKFPIPTTAVHLILVDTRGYLGTGGDAIDYQQITNGAAAIHPDVSWATHFKDGQPILGLFEGATSHPQRAAQTLRERVHFIGFIAERDYHEGEIRNRAYYRPNPHLLPTMAEQQAIARTYPLFNP